MVALLGRWQATVFAEPPLAGNAALIQLWASPPSASDMEQLARDANFPASCFAWRRGGEGQSEWQYDVRCYSPAGPIRCCGHGLLATAHVLHYGMRKALAEPSRKPFGAPTRESITWPGLTLYPGEQERPLNVRQDGSGSGIFWLLLPRLGCRAVPVPIWAERAFGLMPCDAADAGGEAGYLVLEFSAEVSLEKLAVRVEEIAEHTARAVIATQRDATGQYDFLLRYFAPQYGVREDGVTGSANRVLADYWHQRAGDRSFNARQCSASGGVVRSRLVEDGGEPCVALTGRVEVSEYG